MSKAAAPKAMMFRLSVGACVLLAWGCQKSAPPEAYVEAYTHLAKEVQPAGEYQVTVMALSPEYLVAREMDSTWTREAVAAALKEYQKSNYVSVQVELAHPTGGPDDLGRDFVNRALVEGEEAYRRRLTFLENEAGAFVRLKCQDGRPIAPVSFRFTRGMGFPGIHSFLFLFPKQQDGKEVSLQGSRLMLKDLGLSPGILELPLRLPPHLSLKVHA
jgi:hypothetical protein